MRDKLVFQVKSYESKPLGHPTAEDYYKWITAAISHEKKKIARLRTRGISEFIFVTNIPASGDLDSGLRDRVAGYLNSNLPVPSTVWWREDVDTRLRAHPQVAATHGLLAGIDGLRDLIQLVTGYSKSGTEHSNPEVHAAINKADAKAHAKALLSYIAEQYKMDRLLRFKQADLDQTLILDAFVDVEYAVTHSGGRSQRQFLDSGDALDLEYSDSTDATSSPRRYHPAYSRRNAPGLAERLLIGSTSNIPRLLIEGAPGQGKSTLTQYLCQVHRIRLLDKPDEIQKLPDSHRYSPIRIPFRVEMRHYSAWLSQKPAHDPDIPVGILAYISARIRESSDLRFDTDDTVEVVSSTPTLIVLDGLDEVAEIEVRYRVMQEIERFARNLETWAADSQLIITSRPTSTVQLPQLADDGLLRVYLTDLSRPRIEEYAHKWLMLRHLPPDEVEQFRDVLERSLSSTHISDLATNPMQLAILLFLVHRRGWSIPDRRTAFYEAYLETFLMREAEKNETVRRYRDLILELHSYAAWILHSRTEGSDDPDDSSGSMRREELEALLSDYLRAEDRQPGLVGELFSGVQRVFILVERYEGRFEFEVQPLREFFVAKYLYSTSPQTPAQPNDTSTRPDRLAAMLANPHWDNVTRFFCGYYQKGELADLARHLSDMLSAPGGYNRRNVQLVASIIRDRSFVASQRDTKILVSLLSRPAGMVLMDDERGIRFDDETGRETLVRAARLALEEPTTAPDYASTFATFVGANDTHVCEWWLNQLTQKASQKARTEWLRMGVLTRAIQDLPIDRALEIFSPHNELTELDWLRCIEASRDDITFHDPRRLKLALSALGNAPTGLSSYRPYTREASWIHSIKDALHPARWRRARSSIATLQWASPMRVPELARVDTEVEEVLSPVVDLIEFLETGRTITRNTRNNWWNTAIDRCVTAFGESWLTWRCATFAATLPGQRLEDLSSGLSGKALTILRKTIEAISISNSAQPDKDFEVDLIENVNSNAERMGLTALIITYARTEVLVRILPRIAGQWDSIGSRELLEIKVLGGLLKSIRGNFHRPRSLTLKELDAISNCPASLQILCSDRATGRVRTEMASRIRSRELRDAERLLVNGELATYLASTVASPGTKSGDYLVEIARRYETGRLTQYRSLGSVHVALRNPTLALKRFPNHLAQEVLLEAERYPIELVMLADYLVTYSRASNVRPISDVANVGNWFRLT